MIGRAFSRNHVARNGPWRAAEADKIDIARQGFARAADGFENGRKFGEIDLFSQRKKIRVRLNGRKPRSLAQFKADMLPQSVWHDENVAEHDGGVEAEPTDRLQRRLRRKPRRVAEVENVGAVARISRYSGRYRPACRINQIGGVGCARPPSVCRNLLGAGAAMFIEDPLGQAHRPGRAQTPPSRRMRALFRRRRKCFEVGDHIVDVIVGREAREGHFRPRHFGARVLQVDL